MQGGALNIGALYHNRFVRWFYHRSSRPLLGFMEWCTRHAGITVLVLLVIGMGLRIGYRFIVDRPERDEITYIACVEKAAVSGIESLNDPSQRLLVYVGVWLQKAGVDSELGLRCFNLTCSFLWLGMIYIIGKNIFLSEKAGICCLILAVFNPYTIRMAGQVLREPLYLLLFTVGFHCSVQIVRGWRMVFFAFLLGAITVLAAWTRIEGAEMLSWLPLALLIYSVGTMHTSGRLRWKPLLCCCAAYLLSLCGMGMVLFSVSPDYAAGFASKFRGVFPL